MTNAMDVAEFKHFLGKARDACRGGRDAWNCQSTGERLAVALVLNKHEWLQAMDYTMAEAIDRVGAVWMGLVPKVVKALKDEGLL